jgi:adenine-specific DNA-methyltransferase
VKSPDGSRTNEAPRVSLGNWGGRRVADKTRLRLELANNLLVVGSLLQKFTGKIVLIDVDPRFATGADCSYAAAIGNQGDEFDGDELSMEQSAIYETTYRKDLGAGSKFLPVADVQPASR